MRRWLSYILAIVILLGLTLPIQAAEVPYESFVQTENNPGLPAPAGYEVVDIWDGSSLGGESWDAPQDMGFDETGNLYLVDTGNNRILKYDKDFKFVKEIKELKNADGTPSEKSMLNPRSIFIAQDGSIYVADTDNERCLKLDQDGTILQEYVKPTSAAYSSEVYNPIKILADPEGDVYIISQNVYQGIIVYTNDGEFKTYYGSPPVVVTAKLLIDRFWKRLMSERIRDSLADYVPVEYTSFDIDEDGFIYTASVYTDDNQQQIRRLNYLGANILANTGNLGESEIFYYRLQYWTTQFADICVAGNNILAIDSRYQRGYVFDLKGNRLLNFGTSGEQTGAFLRASAIEYRDGTIYVLDSLKNNLTAFKATPYGELILTASDYDTEGDYDEAEVYWKKVLAQNANCEMAYTGIGEARMKNEDYEGAMEYFRLGNNRERESVAFGYYRTELLRAGMVVLIPCLLILLVALILFTNQKFSAMVGRKLRKGKKEKVKKERAWRTAWQVMTHPLNTLNELKHRRYQNIGFIIAVLGIWTVVSILSRQLTSFRFNMADPNNFNLPLEITFCIVPFIMVAAVNWAVCAIQDGEGKFFEISTYLAFAMVPYIIVTALSIILSQFLTLNEGVFIQFVQWIGILWSAMLVFQGQRIVHNYTTPKTLLAAFLTLVGIVVVLIIFLLVFTLVLQVSNFVTSIYTELSLRK